MPEIADWLKRLGMAEYAERFIENKVDFSILPHLTDQDLKEIGIPLGHRRKILAAIGELRVAAPAKSEPAAVEPESQDTAERRQVTVMFSDLVGSTALSTRMDPEDLREIISTYQNCVAEIVGRVDGFVAKYMGDGVLVYFGYPQAHEDDAERAVRAGLDLVAAIAALSSPVPLQTRVGIATGLVVVGTLTGSGSAQERGIVGETPNLAARLQAIAEPNSVVIAESTRKLLGNLFELKDLGARDLKGLAGPVPAWAALRARSVESRFEALHAGGLTSLVGREEEAELLRRRWSRAKTGEGQVVLLSGEPGIGKSRLTAALLQSVAKEPHTRLRYFCSSQHVDSAFYPVIGQMERAAEMAHDDTPKMRLDKLDAMLAQTSTSIENAALFAEMLSLPNDGRYPTLDLEPHQRRRRTLEALSLQMETLARSNPLLVIFEDAHWADPTTLEAIDRVVDRIQVLRVLLVVTFRPEFAAPWIGRPHVTALTINRLAGRDVDAIIDRVAGDKLLPANIRQDIIERTDGIPLFVEEMTKAVLEAGTESAAAQTVAAVPSPALVVPASLHASLMARLDRLGDAKEVAQIGAAIGREFSHDLLASVTRKPEAELGSALGRLIAAGLLFRQGTPPHATYLFKHALVQDAAYSTLLREPRRALHASIAEVIESRFKEIVERQPELLAHHFTAAGLTGPAVLYWRQAGQHASNRSAFVEATRHFNAGIELLKTLPETPERAEQELALYTGLGAALIVTRGHGTVEVEQAYLKAHALCLQLGKTAELFPVLLGLWRCYIAQSQLHKSRELGEHLLRLSNVGDDPARPVVAHYALGNSSLLLAELPAARQHFEDGIVHYGPEQRRLHVFRDAQDPGVGCRSYSALCLWLMGFPDQAQARAYEALTLARELKQPYSEAYALCCCAFVSQFRRDAGQTRDQAEAAMALATEHGFAPWVAVATGFLGWALGEQGESEKGLAILQRGVAALQAMRAGIWFPFRCTMLAEVLDLAGKTKGALQSLAEARTTMDQTQERWWEAEVYRLQGELLWRHAMVPLSEVESLLRRAVDTARRQGARSLELRATTSLARLWRHQGKQAEAHGLLASIHGWFTEGFETPDFKDAKALLEELHRRTA